MTSALGTFVTITFVSTSDTPTAALPLAGKTFLFPPEYLPDIGSGPGNPGVITAAGQRVRGWLDSTVPADLKWIMTNELPAAAQTQVDAIPGGLGWVRPASRNTYITVGRTLVRDFNVPVPDVIQALGACYQAAALNRDAQLAAGG